MPWPVSTRCIAARSTAAPATAALREGPASSTGVNTIVSPPPAARAEPAKTKGSCRCGACHDGTAVFASSTAVYVAIGPPNRADTAPPNRLGGGHQPTSSAAAVAPAAAAPPPAPATGDGMWVPTDSGDVGLIARSMCRNRSGRPRSWMRNPTEAMEPPPATSRATRVSPRPAGHTRQRAQDRRGARRAAEEKIQRHVRRLPHRRLDDRAVVVRRELDVLDHRELAGTAPPAAPAVPFPGRPAVGLSRPAVGPAPAGAGRRQSLGHGGHRLRDPRTAEIATPTIIAAPAAADRHIDGRSRVVTTGSGGSP